MASFYSTQSCAITDPRAFEPLPNALCRTSLIMRVLRLLALGHPNLDDHWKSLQSEQAFETIRSRLCSILTSTIATASVLLAISSVFISMSSPVSYFDYTLPVPYSLLFISLMLAMIAMLKSGSSMICWWHANRHWTREQLKQGGCFILSYLLSIVTPIFFVGLSLHCFMFAMLVAGFSSQSMICRAATALWLIAYAVNIGTILIEAMWKYATSLYQRLTGSM
ncbi:hypothetical protein C8R48DRAFT_672224 [Suillus tomentosus]|nr:hypothetical protein C8R48DRAFT_672224 [Suillus tomentosus]